MALLLKQTRSGLILQRTDGITVNYTGSSPSTKTITTLTSSTEIDSGVTTRPKFIEVYDSSGNKLSDLTIGPSNVTQPGGSGTNWIIKFPNLTSTKSNVTLYFIAS